MAKAFSCCHSDHGHEKILIPSHVTHTGERDVKKDLDRPRRDVVIGRAGASSSLLKRRPAVATTVRREAWREASWRPPSLPRRRKAPAAAETVASQPDAATFETQAMKVKRRQAAKAALMRVRKQTAKSSAKAQKTLRRAKSGDL